MKGTYGSHDVAYIYFTAETVKMRQYLTNILKYDTSSDDMKEKIYHWLYSCEIFHKKYIIMPKESYTT